MDLALDIMLANDAVPALFLGPAEAKGQRGGGPQKQALDSLCIPEQQCNTTNMAT